jgi:hypothetical protein
LENLQRQRQHPAFSFTFFITDMNTKTDYLSAIAEEIVSNTDENTLITEANPHFKMEAKRLEKDIIESLYNIENDTRRDTFHYNTIRTLVTICDMLFDATCSVNPNVQVLLDLLTNIKQILPNQIRPNLKLPKAFVLSNEPTFIAFWERHDKIMARQDIAGELIDIAAIPFVHFRLKNQHLYWGDYTWLRGYKAKLDIMDWEHADCSSKTEALVSLLIGRNFNDERFYIYCKKYIQIRLTAVEGKRARINELALCERLVLEDTQDGMAAFDQHANTISTRLLKWIREEIDYIEMHEREQPFLKFQFKWTAEMIACFFKLMHERKVFGNVTLERFAETIAANCSSVDKKDFQASTIYSRFYKKDVELMKSIEKILKDILGGLSGFQD